MNIQDVPNYRQIRFKYLPPTNNRVARLKVYEPERFYDTPVKSRIIKIDNEPSESTEQFCLRWLIETGFKPVARATESKEWIFFCDNWAENFMELSGEYSDYAKRVRVKYNIN